MIKKLLKSKATLKRTGLWMLTLVFILHSVVIPVGALDLPYDYSGWGDIPSYLSPDSLLQNIPQYGGDPTGIPNPAAGIIPGTPRGAAGSSIPPMAPLSISLPEPPPTKALQQL